MGKVEYSKNLKEKESCWPEPLEEKRRPMGRIGVETENVPAGGLP